MIEAKIFLETAQKMGFNYYSGVPCSYLQSFINYVMDSPNLHYIPASNEGDAVAIASGLELGGKRGVVMIQNSGLGNALNPLTSLNATFKIPILLIVTWRGQPGDIPDEPQHDLMGEITPGLLDLLKIPWAMFPENEHSIESVLQEALRSMNTTRLPFVLVMRKNSVRPYGTPHTRRYVSPTKPSDRTLQKQCERRDVLKIIQQHANPTDAIIATTGYTSRSLYQLRDSSNQFYMVGSMGCASSLGLGVAIARPKKRVIILDGDGAALMRLGALATVAHESPSNVIHVLLDNESYESTGGQHTTASSVDFAAIAHASGYPRVIRIQNIHEVESAIKSAGNELTFIHIKTSLEKSQNLQRPKEHTEDLALRFKQWLTT